MFEVHCPGPCGKTRTVRAKKPWMVGDGPFEKLCRSCSQLGKEKSDEHKQKLAEAVREAQTPELLHQKSEYRKAHPEIWQHCLTGQGGGWNKGLKLPPRSDETKQKIGEGVHRASVNKKGGGQ